MRAHVRLALVLMFITIGSGLAGTGTAQVLSGEQLAQSIKMREDAIKQKNAKIAEQEEWIKAREKAIADAQRAQAKYRKICEDPEQVVIRLILEAGAGNRYAVTARSKADLQDDLYFFALFDLMDPDKKKEGYEDEVAMMMGASERAQALLKALESRSNEYKRTLLVEVNRLAQVIENGRIRIQEAKKDIARWKGEITQLTKDIDTLRKQKQPDKYQRMAGSWEFGRKGKGSNKPQVIGNITLTLDNGTHGHIIGGPYRHSNESFWDFDGSSDSTVVFKHKDGSRTSELKRVNWEYWEGPYFPHKDAPAEDVTHYIKRKIK